MGEKEEILKNLKDEHEARLQAMRTCTEQPRKSELYWVAYGVDVAINVVKEPGFYGA